MNQSHTDTLPARLHRSFLLGTLLLAVPFLHGCGLIETEEPLALTATLEADRLSAAPEEVIRFFAEGTGQHIGALILDLGDGGQESHDVAGARRASMEVNWAYEEPGTYRVELEVLEFSGAGATDALEITIIEP
jgi:hypothetical protein